MYGVVTGSTNSHNETSKQIKKSKNMSQLMNLDQENSSNFGYNVQRT